MSSRKNHKVVFYGIFGGTELKNKHFHGKAVGYSFYEELKRLSKTKSKHKLSFSILYSRNDCRKSSFTARI